MGRQRLDILTVGDIVNLDTAAKLRTAIQTAPYVPTNGVFGFVPIMKFTPDCKDCAKTIQTLLFDWYAEGCELKLYDDRGYTSDKRGVIFANEDKLPGERRPE